ncbi:hypothetical protein, partial [Pseudomonas viridiflava]|uniref:hypothetical protein n=1 Tax=Pseudomonas viridiflava TaxID=33069 RepID=UPI001A7E1FB3
RPIIMSGKRPDNHRLRCPEKVDHYTGHFGDEAVFQKYSWDVTHQTGYFPGLRHGRCNFFHKVVEIKLSHNFKRARPVVPFENT